MATLTIHTPSLEEKILSSVILVIASFLPTEDKFTLIKTKKTYTKCIFMLPLELSLNISDVDKLKAFLIRYNYTLKLKSNECNNKCILDNFSPLLEKLFLRLTISKWTSLVLLPKREVNSFEENIFLLLEYIALRRNLFTKEEYKDYYSKHYLKFSEEEWLSLQDHTKYLNILPLCTYSPPRGKDRNNVCMKIANNALTEPNPYGWRCPYHFGRIGGYNRLVFSPFKVSGEYYSDLTTTMLF